MSELDAISRLADLAIMVIGLASGVWVGVRAGLSALREDLRGIHSELRVLSGRVTESEEDIEGLEGRESV